MNLEYKQEKKIFFKLHLVFSTPRKAFIYGLFRNFSSYSNSGADRIIQVLFSTHLCRFAFIFSGFYLLFFYQQIIRAKIEPDKTIFSALIAPILIVVNAKYQGTRYLAFTFRLLYKFHNHQYCLVFRMHFLYTYYNY